MRIRCCDCGHSEEVNFDFFVKVLGAAAADFGFWAWVSFLFAGTGLALPICIAIVSGGIGILAYKDQVVDWIAKKAYPCRQCSGQRWGAVSVEVEMEINAREAVIAKLAWDAEDLRRDAQAKEKEISDTIRAQGDVFSMEDVQELLDQEENQKAEIAALLQRNEDLAKQLKALGDARVKLRRNFETRFKACYSSLSFTGSSLKSIVKLSEKDGDKLEAQFGFLQHNPQKANFRDDIVGTDIKEIGFGDGGRLYIRKEGSRFLVVCVGNKNSQSKDIANLKRSYGRG